MNNELKEGCAAFAKPISQIKTAAFNLEAARAGATIQQKNGRPAEFVAYCEKAVYPLVVVTSPTNLIHPYKADGRAVDIGNEEYDLVMVVSIETRYVNLFADGHAAVRGSGEHFATAEEAETRARDWMATGGTPMLAVAAPIEVQARSA